MSLNSKKLLEIVENFKGKKIAVIGDLMLDIYLKGKVNRISPEAPVPIVNVSSSSSCLGGAGNVMRNIATLGGTTIAYGMIGDDKEGEELKNQLTSYGIDSHAISVAKGRITTQKTRVLAGSQQLLRIDQEQAIAATEEIRNEIVSKVLELIKSQAIDAIIFEDYGKGLLSSEMLNSIIIEANKVNILTILDPKPGSLEPVQNLTVIKPNRKEAYELVGRSEPMDKSNAQELDAIASQIRQMWNPEYILISLAAEGMALYDPLGNCSIIPTCAREVFDVSGAGDTVVSALALALTAGASPTEAAAIGNYAAGVVVSKIGTVTVSKEELITVMKD